ncbi:UNVERIFIED_CONTAM: putative ribonuclease H protein [Sesamum radiatum]|uniref:Ribonuclease H protein n=1 Tax=Sesamum radiatum TaxID=300843 RepID=A0AAW2SJF3_SESRA
MQKVLDLLIDYSQNAFIPGRSISDNILLAQELLAGYNQTRLPPRCTIKVDLQKAYDSVQWDFLLEVLKLFKFPTRFIGWIEQCVSSATFSVSLNGSIYGFFPAQEDFNKGSTGRGCAKVAWDQICRPKEEGGLGFHNILVINKALMLKHLWKIVQNDRHSIWVDWILHHRLRNNSLWTFNGSTGSWGWKKIIKLRPVLQRGLIYQVGNGTTFKLWQDIWHQQGPLSIAFRGGQKLQFSVKSATELIQPPNDRVVWHGLLQGRYKIPRHNFILWLAILEKLSTLDKHWISRGDNGCVLCDGQYVESHDHLFFNCLYTRRCLQIVQRQVRFHWPLSGWQQCIKWASKRWRSEHLINAASRALLAALVYYIWIERNNRKFTATSSAAESVARRVIEEVRLRILSDEFIPSLQTRTLYRIWKIAWPIGL